MTEKVYIFAKTYDDRPNSDRVFTAGPYPWRVIDAALQVRIDALPADQVTELTALRDVPGQISDLAALITTANVAYLTKSDMDADTAQPGGTLALVFDDATPANNGLYVFTAGSPGSWAKTTLQLLTATDVSSKADASRTITGGGLATGGGTLEADRVVTVTEASEAEARAGAASNVALTPRRMAAAVDGLRVATNLVPDPLLEELSAGRAFGGVGFIVAGTFNAAPAANNPYDGGSVSAAGGANVDVQISLAALGVAPGETVTVAVRGVHGGAGNRLDVFARRTVGGTVDETGAVTGIASGDQVTFVSVATLSTTTVLQIRLSGAATKELVAWSVAKGFTQAAFAYGGEGPITRPGGAAANLAPDPFWRLLDAGITRVGAYSTLPTSVAGVELIDAPSASPFITKAVEIAEGQGFKDFMIDASRLGLQVGALMEVRLGVIANQAFRLNAYFRTEADSVLGTFSESTVNPGGGYAEVAVELTITSAMVAAAKLNIRTMLGATVGAAGVQICAVAVRYGRNLPAIRDVEYKLDQTRIDVDSAYVSYRNLHPDPVFEGLAAGLKVGAAGADINQPGLTIVDQPAGSPFTGKALEIAAGEGTKNFDIPAELLDLKEGDVLRVTVGYSGSGTANIAAFLRDVSNTVLTDTIASAATIGGYTEITDTITITSSMAANAAYLQIQLMSLITAAAGGVKVCGIGIYKAARNLPLAGLYRNPPALSRPATINLARLRETRQRLELREMNEAGRLVIAAIGDSFTHNQFRYSLPLTQRLQGHLNDQGNAYGDGGVGWTGFGSASGTSDNANVKTFTGGYTLAHAGTWDYSAYATSVSPDVCQISSSTAGAKVTVTAPSGSPVLSAARLFWVGTADGVVRYRWDAGAWTSINVQGTVGDLETALLGGLPGAGNWTFEIEVVSGAVTLCGVDFQSATNGIVYHKLGATGSRLQQWVAVEAAEWQAGMTLLAPNLVIVMHGTNDQGANRRTWQFKADMETLVARIRAAAPLADILLVAPPENQRANTYKMQGFAQVTREVAEENDCAFIDLQDSFGVEASDYASGSDRNWFNADTVHPEPATGGRAMVAALRRAILFG